MDFQSILNEKRAFVFDLDNVLYPEKDYLLQVYYLFAQFIEYGEQINAAEMVTFMQAVYLEEGAEGIFERTAEKFNIPLKYKLNFDLLLQNARLPLKLLIYEGVLNLLQEVAGQAKQLFLFADGHPQMQLNKIRQVDWNGLEKNLVVYFAEESAPKPDPKGLELIMEKHNLKPEEVVLIGHTENDRICAGSAGIDFFSVDKLL